MTNLCKHFKCPHYSDERHCERYLVAEHCPVNEINGVGVSGSEYFLTINLGNTNPYSRDLIRHGIAMTSMEPDENA